MLKEASKSLGTAAPGPIAGPTESGVFRKVNPQQGKEYKNAGPESKHMSLWRIEGGKPRRWLRTSG